MSSKIHSSESGHLSWSFKHDERQATHMHEMHSPVEKAKKRFIHCFTLFQCLFFFYRGPVILTILREKHATHIMRLGQAFLFYILPVFKAFSSWTCRRIMGVRWLSSYLYSLPFSIYLIECKTTFQTHYLLQ